MNKTETRSADEPWTPIILLSDLPARASQSPASQSPAKSLAPYRDCLGRERWAKTRCAGRGSFDRDDLKEAASTAVQVVSICQTSEWRVILPDHHFHGLATR